MKKKIVAMMLASMMAFNLIGCGETQKESNAPEEKQESIESKEGSDEKESAESTPVPTVEADLSSKVCKFFYFFIGGQILTADLMLFH